MELLAFAKTAVSNEGFKDIECCIGLVHQGDKTIGKVIIDDEVTEIAAYAFNGCTKLKVIVFSPNCKVKKIGYDAFAKCTALEEVDFPNSLEELEGESGMLGAFGACSNLTKVSFGSNLKIVGEATFYQCIKLEAIVLKESVTTIGKIAFKGCSNLSTFVWTESVTTVGDDVFENCTKLHEVAGSDKQDDVIAYGGDILTDIRGLLRALVISLEQLYVIDGEGSVESAGESGGGDVDADNIADTSFER